MDDLIKKIMPTLLVTAIVASVTAIWRFEVTASETSSKIEQIEKHYTKKEEFVVVKVDLKHLKEKQEKMDKKIDVILEAVRK